jgi:hypothetical protein
MPSSCEPRGRGGNPISPAAVEGTDLRAGFARALATNPRPDVIVVLTDGQTP